MKIIKWLLWSGLIIVVIAVGSALFLVNKVDPNDYKSQIAQQIESQIGRKLSIDGDLSWRFYPWVGITLNDFSLSNRAGFSPDSMLSAKQADIQLKLIPLLSKQVEIGKVQLSNPKLNLSINAKGETNWGDVTAQSSSDKNTDMPSEQAAGAMVGGLVIQGVDVSNGEISWNDQLSGQHYNLSAFNLKTGKVKPGEPISFDLNTGLQASVLPESANFSLIGNLLLSERFDKVEIDTIVSNFEMGDTTAQLNIEDIQFDLQSGVLAVTKAGGELSMDQLSTDVSVDAISLKTETGVAALSGLAYEGQFELFPYKGQADQVTFNSNAGLLSIKNKSITSEFNKLPLLINAKSVDYSINNETLLIPKLNLKADQADINLDLNIQNLLGALSASGHVGTNQFNVRNLLDKIGIDPLSDLPNDALQNIRLETDFKVGLSSLALTGLTAKVDDTTVTGDFRLNDFSSLASHFKINIDHLNIDQYLSEDNATVAQETGPGAAVALPFIALKGLDVKGTLAVGELKAQDLLSKDVTITVDTGTDIIKIEPLRAKLYGGETINTFIYDISGDVPAVKIDSKLSSIDLGSFLNAMKMTDRLDGFGNINSVVNTSGLNADEMISNLNGDINIALKNGQITGVSIQKTLLELAEIYKKVKGKDLGLSADLGDNTEFSDFNSDIHITNGVLNTDNLDLRAPGFRVTGGGKVNLNNETLDMVINISVVKSFEGQGGQALDELKGETIPVKISGSLFAPKILPDISKIVQRQLERKLSEKYLGKKVSGDDFKKTLNNELNRKLAEELGQGTNETEQPNNNQNKSVESVDQSQDQPSLTPKAPEKTQKQLLKEKLKQEEKKLKSKLLNKLFGG